MVIQTGDFAAQEYCKTDVPSRKFCFDSFALMSAGNEWPSFDFKALFTSRKDTPNMLAGQGQRYVYKQNFTGRVY